MSKIALDQKSGLYVDQESGRIFFLDEPDDLKAGEKVTFLLNLHGGGSHGIWQHLYFPAQDYQNKYRLVITTPTAKTKEPSRHWLLKLTTSGCRISSNSSAINTAKPASNRFGSSVIARGG